MSTMSSFFWIVITYNNSIYHQKNICFVLNTFNCVTQNASQFLSLLLLLDKVYKRNKKGSRDRVVKAADSKPAGMFPHRLV